MARKKISRKELLKEKDEFLTLSERAVNFLAAHRRQMEHVGLGVAVVIVCYLAVTTYLRHVNRKGQDAYNFAYYLLAENLKTDGDAAKLKESAELFQKVEDKYGLSKAARLALPQIAYLRFLDKDYDGAIGLYRKFLKKVSHDTPFPSLVGLAVAACYEAKGDLKTAIETLTPIAGDPQDPLQETAMLSLARVYRVDKQPEKSKEILKQFVEEYQDSPFLPLVKAYL